MASLVECVPEHHSATALRESEIETLLSTNCKRACEKRPLPTISSDTEKPCQRRIRELVDKQEARVEELLLQEKFLQQRLQMLECSLPAVTVWKVWHSGDPEDRAEVLRRILEDAAPKSAQHQDERVREAEACRKEAQRRAEEARRLWFKREAALQAQLARLEEARKQLAERTARADSLAAEARILDRERRDLERKTDDLQLRCFESTTFLHAGNSNCLRSITSLSKADFSTKRHISDLQVQETVCPIALAQVTPRKIDSELPVSQIQTDFQSEFQTQHQTETQTEYQTETHNQHQDEVLTDKPTEIQLKFRIDTQDKSMMTMKRPKKYYKNGVRSRLTNTVLRTNSADKALQVIAQSKDDVMSKDDHDQKEVCKLSGQKQDILFQDKSVEAMVQSSSIGVGNYLSVANKAVITCDVEDQESLNSMANKMKSNQNAIDNIEDRKYQLETLNEAVNESDSDDNEKMKNCSDSEDTLCSDNLCVCQVTLEQERSLKSLNHSINTSSLNTNMPHEFKPCICQPKQKKFKMNISYLNSLEKDCN